MSTVRGYTLVELLIITTIVGILITVGASAYSRARKRQDVKAATDTLTTTLARAQKMSIIGDKDCSGALSGFRVTTTAGGNSTTTTAVCEGGDGTPKVETVSGVSIASSTNILFRPLGQGVYLGGASEGYLDFNLTSDPNTTYRLSIHQSGTIRNEGKQ